MPFDLSGVTTEELQGELAKRQAPVVVDTPLPEGDAPAETPAAPPVDVVALNLERDRLQAEANPLRARVGEIEDRLKEIAELVEPPAPATQGADA